MAAGAAVVALAAGVTGCGGARSLKWRDDEAAWSPTGATIAFVSNRARPTTDVNQLYSMNANGSSLRKIAGAGDAAYPRFSPDGQTIVYFTHASGNADLARVGADGVGRKTLTTWGDLNSTIPPAWSPNGQWIAFARETDTTDPMAQSELWVIDAYGTQAWRVARRIDAHGYSPAFAWALDSRQIAFGCSKGGLCLVAARGGAIRQLSSGGFGDQVTSSVAWSPDGKQIAFVRDTGCDCDTPNTHAWVIDASGKNERRLPRFSEGSVSDLAWLPKHPGVLVAAGNKSGHIYLLRSNGTAKHDVPGKGWDSEPVPSPDGTRIVFDRFGPVPDSDAPQPAALVLTTLPHGRVQTLTQRSG